MNQESHVFSEAETWECQKTLAELTPEVKIAIVWRQHDSSEVLQQFLQLVAQQDFAQKGKLNLCN